MHESLDEFEFRQDSSQVMELAALGRLNYQCIML